MPGLFRASPPTTDTVYGSATGSVEVLRRHVLGEHGGRLPLVQETGAAEVLTERCQVDRSAYHLGEPHRVHRLEHVGLRLDHLIFHRVLQLLLRIPDQPQPDEVRSEERREGKECVSTCRSRWARDNKK